MNRYVEDVGDHGTNVLLRALSCQYTVGLKGDHSDDALGQPDIIFLAYVAYDDARNCYERANVAIIIGNHRDLSPKNEYIQRFLRFYEYEGMQRSFIYRLMFGKPATYDFFIITKPRYCREIYAFLREFACPANNEHFYFGGFPMPLIKRWALDSKPFIIKPAEGR